MLYTREERENPDILYYGNNSHSIETSRFNASNGLKVVIHGFKGSGTDLGAKNGALKLLDLVWILHCIILLIPRVHSVKWAQTMGNRVIFSRKRGKKGKDWTLIVTRRKEEKNVSWENVIFLFIFI